VKLISDGDTLPAASVRAVSESLYLPFLSFFG